MYCEEQRIEIPVSKPIEKKKIVAPINIINIKTHSARSTYDSVSVKIKIFSTYSLKKMSLFTEGINGSI